MKKVRVNKKKYWTLVVIPGNQQEIRIQKIPRWLPWVSAVITAAALLSIFFVFVSNNKLKQETAALKDLREVNRQLEEQVQEISRQTSDMKDRIQFAVESDRYIREVLSEIRKPGSGSALSSRGTSERRTLDPDLIYFSLDGQIEVPDTSYNYGMDLLAESRQDIQAIDLQVERLIDGQKSLKQAVMETQQYLNSIPSRWPLSGIVSSPYGYRRSPITGRRELHDGLDIAARKGTPVKAAGSGKVVFVGRNGGYGLSVIIDHGYGYRSLYGHNSQTTAKVGQFVKAGEVISRVGSTGLSTGPHLHFTVYKNNKTIDPSELL